MKKNWISNGLIMIGVILILIPIIGRIYVKHEQAKMLEQFNQASLKSFEQANESLANLQNQKNEQAADSIEMESEIDIGLPINDIDSNTNQKIDLGSVIGIINIPKIDITLPILEGTSEAQLSKGIGHLPDTGLPGKIGENMALAGHRGATFSTFFNHIGELENDDLIYIMTQQNQLEYRVYDSLIIDPTDFSVLNPVEDESIVTLITCHPEYSDKQRRIVHAKLVKKIPNK